MKNRLFWSVALATIIGIVLGSCSSSGQARRIEQTQISPPLAKAMTPETKREIPVSAAPAPATEIRKEIPPSAPSPAPKKKKKG